MKNYLLLHLCVLLLSVSCKSRNDIGIESLVNMNNVPKDELEIYKKLKENPDNLKNNIVLWAKLSRDFRYEDLVDHASSVYYRAQNMGNDSLMSFAAAYVSQAYLLLNNLDSVQLYLNRVEPRYIEKDLVLYAMVNNVSATYAMRAHLDYSKALQYYMNALNAMEKAGSLDNQVSLLCNIASLYFEREDSTGLRYADKAYNLIKSINVPHLQVHSGLVKAQLLYLSRRFHESLEVLAVTYQKAENLGYSMYLPVLDMTMADVYFKMDRTEKAREYYERALAQKDSIESGTVIQIMQHYADFLLSIHEYDEAYSLYEEALGLSYSTGNIEARQKILTGLSDVLFLLGRKQEALEVYRNAHRYQDTLLSKQKDMEFNKLLISFERKEKDSQIEIRDLTLAKTKRTAVIIILVLVIIIAGVLTALFYIRKRNKMYRLMVEKHQEQFQKNRLIRNMSEESKKIMLMEKDINPNLVETLAKEDNADGPVSVDENLLNIYLSIEKLMKEEKLYRDRDISLESLASRLATNRSYVSRAINAYAENTFYNYINAYRVEEATSILSDVSRDVTLKNLAGDLGYNSISSFYRAFQKETGCPPAKYREQILKSQSSSNVNM